MKSRFRLNLDYNHQQESKFSHNRIYINDVVIVFQTYQTLFKLNGIDKYLAIRLSGRQNTGLIQIIIIIQDQSQNLFLSMQKLKVYLTRQQFQNPPHTSSDKSKHNGFKQPTQNSDHPNHNHNYSHGSHNYMNAYGHSISQNSLGKSGYRQQHQSMSHQGGLPKSTIANSNGITGHANQKKRTVSNSHNRSLQNIYDFRAEVRSLIKDQPARYSEYRNSDKERQQQNRSHMDNHNYNKMKGAIHGSKKEHKQVASQSRLGYRSQPHKQEGLERNRHNKSQKNIETFASKIQPYNNSIKQMKAVIGLKPSVKQQTASFNKVSVAPKHLPTKKRSKSANPDNKKLGLSDQPEKRSNSVKKVANTHSRNNPNHSRSQLKNNLLPLESSLKNTKDLCCISGLVLKSMFRTRKGVQIMNPNKVNQDRLYLRENIRYQKDDQTEQSQKQGRYMSIYAVADGHGPHGHFVSHLIVDNLHKKFDHHLKSKQNQRNKNKDLSIHSMGSTIETALQKSFTDIQSMLTKGNDFNADFSGSTLVTLIIENNKNLICANVGDSRAIVARQLNKTSWEVVRLSNDHKPSVEEERARILGQGGRIDTVYDQNGNSVGPLRVWLPKKQIQGLAMSRSIGDNISKPIGVTHVPEILAHEMTKDDKFILLASDGVWQFLTNYQILSLIIPYYRQNRLDDACEALMKQAYRSWTKEDNTVIDDITFILIFISSDSNEKDENIKDVKRQQKMGNKNEFKNEEIASKLSKNGHKISETMKQDQYQNQEKVQQS